MNSDETQRQRIVMQKELDDLIEGGHVKKVFLLPTVFGGTDDPRNVTWLPSLAVHEKEKFDAVVLKRVQCGEVVKYEATPTYDEDSMLPDSLSLCATGDTHNECIIDIKKYKTWRDK